jgi:hypothetical protein
MKLHHFYINADDDFLVDMQAAKKEIQRAKRKLN